MFVCLGNICRSPLAEGIFKQIVSERELGAYFYADSAGTSSYHCGSGPDSRSIQVANKYSIDLNHKAQQLTAVHLSEFEYILAMDEKNLADINLLKARLDTMKAGRIFLMREFDEERSGSDVPDPYFGEMDGFDHVYQMLSRSCKKFVEFLVAEHIKD